MFIFIFFGEIISDISVSFIRTNSGDIHIALDNKAFVVPKSHVKYKEILESLKTKEYDGLENLINTTKAVNEFIGGKGEGKVEVKGGLVYYAGQAVHSVITHCILEFIQEGLPSEPLVLFLENLMKNPSKRAVDELYPFLEHHGMPITERGTFIGYKSVREDFYDHHSGTQLYNIGSTVKRLRNTVNDDWGVACSQGLHVGSLSYAQSFGNGPKKLLLVEVNPEHVVSVPSSDVNKLRTCELYVVGEYDGPLDKPLFNQDEYYEEEEDDEWNVEEDEDDYEEEEEDDWDNDNYNNFGL